MEEVSSHAPSRVSRQTANVLRPWMKTTSGSRASLEELHGFTRMAPKSKPAEKKETVRGDKFTERWGFF